MGRCDRTGLDPVEVRAFLTFWLGQPRREDPHELRRRLGAHLRPRVRQVVLDRRVRQAETVGGGLLRPGDQDGRDDADLTKGEFDRINRKADRILSEKPEA